MEILTLSVLVAVLLAPASGASCDDPTVVSGMAEVAEPVLYYEAAGRDEPVVLIHGGQLDCRMWDVQFRLLSKDFRVIRYDVHGYGRSETPTRVYSVNPYGRPLWQT
jgi:pimeloyl-ACP methyl ester carboxylesterase